MNLKSKSIEIIKANQSSNGAYVACPNFETYKFCWLRDGSFTAYAMDLVGEYQSAELFYRWVDETIKKYGHKVDKLLRKKLNGETIAQTEFLSTRYTLDGFESDDEWTNFQLDGYGSWLWALAEHVKLSRNKQLLSDFKESIQITVLYLTNFWDKPNYDCWEEFGDKIHTVTLACIYGGLKSIDILLSDLGVKKLLVDIKDFILCNCVVNDRLIKFVGAANTDASLLWVCQPFGLLKPEDKIVKNTIKDIETCLLHRGGVHRYPEDNYYGGGEWLLLSCWLGWYYCAAERTGEALEILKWVENQTDREGLMVEQVTDHPNEPEYINIWIKRWGKVAKPLLWSHAMYLVLLTELERSRNLIV